jgi:hypothetical protein
MSNLADLERRLAAVEAAVAELRAQQKTTLDSNWLERIAGISSDNPAFDEVVRLGREFRESHPYPEGVEP